MPDCIFHKTPEVLVCCVPVDRAEHGQQEVMEGAILGAGVGVISPGRFLPGEVDIKLSEFAYGGSFIAIASTPAPEWFSASQLGRDGDG